MHLIIGNHDRNFRFRFNDMLYEDVFETIDDYCEIDMELPVLDESGKITVATTQQSIAMSHFPRLSALAEEHGDWPSNWNEFADMAPTTEGWLLYGHTHQDVPDGTDPRSVNVGLDAWDFKPVSRTADPRLACIPALQPIKVNSTLSMYQRPEAKRSRTPDRDKARYRPHEPKPANTSALNNSHAVPMSPRGLKNENAL